jgi:hypothetical protein
MEISELGNKKSYRDGKHCKRRKNQIYWNQMEFKSNKKSLVFKIKM